MKLPGFPEMPVISAFIRSLMFGCLPAATSFGDSMHIEQSFVGKVLSSWAILPPIVVFSSSR